MLTKQQIKNTITSNARAKDSFSIKDYRITNYWDSNKLECIWIENDDGKATGCDREQFYKMIDTFFKANI